MNNGLGARSLVAAVGWITFAAATSAPTVAMPPGWTQPAFVYHSHDDTYFDLQEVVSLALTHGGRPVVAFAQDVGGDDGPGVWLSEQDVHGGWVSEHVTTHNDHAPSLVVDADGTVTIAFARFDAADSQPVGIDIASRVKGSGTWTVKRIFKGDARAPSLVRQDGHDEVAFQGPGGRLDYASNASGAWHFGHVGSHCCGLPPVLRLASDGTPRIAWASLADQDHQIVPKRVEYSARSGGTWHTSAVPTLSPSYSLSFALHDDQPYIAYFNVARDQPLLSTRQHGKWQTTALAGRGRLYCCEWLPDDLAISSGGTVYVVVHDDSRMRLVSVGTTAISIQTLTNRHGNADYAARIAVHKGKLELVYDRRVPGGRRGIWFTKQT